MVSFREVLVECFPVFVKDLDSLAILGVLKLSIGLEFNLSLVLLNECSHLRLGQKFCSTFLNWFCEFENSVEDDRLAVKEKFIKNFDDIWGSC